MAGVVRWLYALGIGWLMYAGALFLFTLYRSTPEVMFAAGFCAVISAVLFVAAIAVDFRQKQIYNKRNTKSVQLSNSKGSVSMGYKLKCADLGMNCSWEGTGSTMDELMMKGAQHAKGAHKMMSMPPEMMAKVKAAIKQT
jgi:predicted small metal-binding protein